MRILITTIFVCAITLSGCGQKGPLYMSQDSELDQPSSAAVNDKDSDNKSKRKKSAE